MSVFARIGVVAAMALTVAACSGAGDAAEGTPHRGPSDPSGSAAASAAVSPAVLGTTETELEAGTYLLDLVALDVAGTGPDALPPIALAVPPGWANGGGWYVHKAGTELTVSIMFWDVDEVYATPCDWSSEPMLDSGSSPEELASILSERPQRNATDPVEVELGGASGIYLEWSVPDDVDFADCDEGHFESWTGNGWASDRYQQGPGQVDRLWILDVDGERLVIDATIMPSATEADRAELQAVIDSITFD